MSCIDKVNNFSFSPSTCLELVDKLTDNQIEHEFKRIEHLFTGRKTKKAKRHCLPAACSGSADEFPTRWETELKNVNTLLSQLNERLHIVERLSSKFDKINDIASNLGNFRPAAENLVKCESSDASDKGSDRVLSTPPQCPQNSLPYPLILHDQKVDVNLSDILSGCQFKEGRNTEECNFGKVFYKSGNISHPLITIHRFCLKAFLTLLKCAKLSTKTLVLTTIPVLLHAAAKCLLGRHI